MNSKKVNWLFLSIILFEFFIVGAILVLNLVFKVRFSLSIVENLILSEMILFLPALIFILASLNGRGAQSLNEMLGFHKIKISTFFMIILFTILIMPMTTVLNAISMLFVDNAVTAISGDVLRMPFPVMLFMIGIFGPFCEEFVFRGVIYKGYKNSGPVLWSIFWSALLFGLMHLNFNQAAYAIAIGIMFALLVEATGSLWSSAIAHMFFNSQEVCLMYIMNHLRPDTYNGSADYTLTKETLISVIGPYLIIAVIATSLAVCVLVWIAKNERRENALRNIWFWRKSRGAHLVSIPLIIAIVLCLAYMSLDLVLEMLA
ncbi:MAG: CPBP family intramembrane metalloprotease [Lachnospiraceae bacterium]|nr:CPBP family intramembrane metalloprotease [Lachnospiraceae bacterium]